MNKFEVTYKGTTKVNKAKTGALIQEYKLFKINDDEVVESMFYHFRKIIRKLKSLRMIYSNGLQLEKLLRRFFKHEKTRQTLLKMEICTK